MNIKPYGKRVLVKLLENTDVVSDSGLLMPDSMKNEMIRWGTVVAISDEVKSVQTLIEVCFGKHNGVEITPGFVVVKEEEILAWR